MRSPGRESGGQSPLEAYIFRLKSIVFFYAKYVNNFKCKKVGLLIFPFWTPHFVVLIPHFGWTPRLNYTVLPPASGPFDFESGVRVTCDVRYLCANFCLPSRLKPNVRDRQTDVSVRRASSLNSHNKNMCKLYTNLRVAFFDVVNGLDNAKLKQHRFRCAR